MPLLSIQFIILIFSENKLSQSYRFYYIFAFYIELFKWIFYLFVCVCFLCVLLTAVCYLCLYVVLFPLLAFWLSSQHVHKQELNWIELNWIELNNHFCLLLQDTPLRPDSHSAVYRPALWIRESEIVAVFSLLFLRTVVTSPTISQCYFNVCVSIWPSAL